MSSFFKLIFHVEWWKINTGEVTRLKGWVNKSNRIKCQIQWIPIQNLIDWYSTYVTKNPFYFHILCHCLNWCANAIETLWFHSIKLDAEAVCVIEKYSFWNMERPRGKVRKMSYRTNEWERQTMQIPLNNWCESKLKWWEKNVLQMLNTWNSRQQRNINMVIIKTVLKRHKLLTHLLFIFIDLKTTTTKYCIFIIAMVSTKRGRERNTIVKK